MEVINGDCHLSEQFFLEEMTPFPEVSATTTRADADFSVTDNPEAAAEIMTMMMMNPPPPAKKLRPIRRSPEPTAHKPQINDGRREIFGFNPADVDPTRNWFEDEFSSSTDDESDDDGNGGGTGYYDSSMHVEDLTNRKRKRKSSKKIEHFMENLVRKVMQKQEKMHQHLITMMERREKERIMREEKWRWQEMERIKKDEEMRANEISRSKALIALIQNVLGTEIEIPQPSSTDSHFDVVDGSKANMQMQIRDVTSDQINKRWPDAEVQALIMLRTSLDQKIGNIWDEISVAMWNMGYIRTAKKCKEKWENMNKYYKRSVENGKKPFENGKTCPYFNELSMLYKNENFNS